MKFLYLSTEEKLIILKEKKGFAELCNKQNQVQPVIEYIQN